MRILATHLKRPDLHVRVKNLILGISFGSIIFASNDGGSFCRLPTRKFHEAEHSSLNLSLN